MSCIFFNCYRITLFIFTNWLKPTKWNCFSIILTAAHLFVNDQYASYLFGVTSFIHLSLVTWSSRLMESAMGAIYQFIFTIELVVAEALEAVVREFKKINFLTPHLFLIRPSSLVLPNISRLTVDQWQPPDNVHFVLIRTHRWSVISRLCCPFLLLWLKIQKIIIGI